MVFHLLLIPQIIHTAIRRQNSGFISIYMFGFLGIRLIYPVKENSYELKKFQ